MLKGISPLISVILLIAFVISVGTVLSGWVLTFTKQHTKETVERGEEEITCSYANLYIDQATWNATTGRLTLLIENVGSENLQDFKMVVIYNNASVKTFSVTPSGVTLQPGDIEAFYNDSVGPCSAIDSVIFKSDTCPNDARDEIDSTDIANCS